MEIIINLAKLVLIVLLVLTPLVAAVFVEALFLDLSNKRDICVFVGPTPKGVKIFLTSMLGKITIFYIAVIIYEFYHIL